MVSGLANVWVPAQDVDGALDFYQNTLGSTGAGSDLDLYQTA